MRMGTYIYGESFYHRVDARAKIIFTLLFTIALVSSTSLPSSFVMMGMTLIISLAALKARETLVNLRRIALLMFFIIISTPLQQRSGTPLVSMGSFMLISREGMASSLQILSKFIGVSFIFSLLLETERIEDIVRALRCFRIPYSASLTISMTLSMIPALMYRYSEIRDAIDLRSDGKGRHGTLMPSLVSLIVSALKMIPQNASLLEERGFTGKEVPSYKELPMNGFIFTQMLLSVIIPVAFIFWRWK